MEFSLNFEFSFKLGDPALKIKFRAFDSDYYFQGNEKFLT